MENWRPITLLNSDYKLIANVLALRIKKVLPSIINENQSGYVQDRYIGETTAAILDIMEYTKEKEISGILNFIDFEIAFDSIE